MKFVPMFRKSVIVLAAAALALGALALTASGQAAGPAAFLPTRFTVVTEGPVDGPAVLLLPGLTSSRAVFDGEAQLIGKKFRLYRVQINGFSGQPAGPNADGPLLEPLVQELHEYLRANHLHPAVIGHSLGGLLGMMLTDEHPEDVQKLLIVDSLPFYALVFNPNATVDEIRPQATAMRDQVLAVGPDAYAAQAKQTASFLVLNADAQKLVAASSIASDRKVMADAMYEDLTTDLRPRLAGFKTPTTLIYPYDAAVAGPDPSKIDEVYLSAFKTLPGVKIHRIDGSRHFIMYDQPAAFDAAVQEFLK